MHILRDQVQGLRESLYVSRNLLLELRDQLLILPNQVDMLRSLRIE